MAETRAWKTVKKILVFMIGLYALSANAHAAVSQWQDIGGGKARLVAILDPQNNKLEAALHVTLKPGWNTYWHHPGSSGIPPQFDFSQTQNFQPAETGFPVPELINEKGPAFAGYKRDVIFLFKGSFDAALNSNIKLQITLGICETICIPVQANFTIPHRQLLHSDPDALQTISTGRQKLPKPADAEKIIQEKKFSDEGKLQITLAWNSDKHTQPALFVKGPANWFLTPAKLLNADSLSATFEIDLSRVPAGTDFASTKLTYTYRTGSSGVYFIH